FLSASCSSRFFVFSIHAVVFFSFFFFFSSRRRHTRWPRDWSSDVCSSDLALRVDGDHDRLRTVALGDPRNQRRIGESSGVDADLVGTGVEYVRSLVQRTDTAPYSERNKDATGSLADCFQQR